jgi:hypothetical protein
MRRIVLACLASVPLLVVLIAPAPAAAAAPAVAGDQIALEAPGLFRSQEARAALLADGRTAIVWENLREGLWVRFLTADGRPDGPQRLLVPNSELPPNPGAGWWSTSSEAALAPLSDGGFLLFWVGRLQFARLSVFHLDTEERSSDVFLRRFDATGRPVGSREQVNESTAGLQTGVRAVVLDEGRILALWQDNRRGGSIRGRLVGSGGSPRGPEVRIANGGASWPAAAVNRHGDVLVAWSAPGHDDLEVRARLFDGELGPLGRPFTVNTTTALRQGVPAVAAGADGGFLVAWRGETVERREYRNFAQAVTAFGALAGPEWRVGDDTGTLDLAPALVARPGGGYLVAWMIWNRWYVQGLVARELDAGGAPLGDAVKVNQEQAIGAHRFGLAGRGDGSVVVAWEGFHGEERGIQARLLAAAPAP